MAVVACVPVCAAETVKDGVHREYYKSGALMTEGSYKNGKKCGIFREYYDKKNGAGLKWERSYRNGVLNGTCTKYYPINTKDDVRGGGKSGKDKGRPGVACVWKFKDGKPVDIGREYFPNGAMMREWDYRKAEADGIIVMKAFYRTGKVASEKTYRNNVLTSIEVYDKDGCVILNQKYERRGEQNEYKELLAKTNTGSRGGK